MTAEGAIGLAAGFQAGSVALIGWAFGSAVEGLASVIVVWRFSGAGTLSETAGRGRGGPLTRDAPPAIISGDDRRRDALPDDPFDDGNSLASSREILRISTTDNPGEDSRQNLEQQLESAVARRSVEWVEIEDGVRLAAQVATTDPFATMATVCETLAACSSTEDIRTVQFERV